MEPTQYSLELSFDLPVDVSSQHSIRSPKKQKIKNFGLLGRKTSTTGTVETEWNTRAQQLLQRFAPEPAALFRKLAERLAAHEGKAKAGVWDWQSWEEKFYQLLLYRRFVPHPTLLANPDTMEFPVTWGFSPRNDRAALIQALPELRQNRAFAGLRFHTGNLGGGDGFAIFQEFARTLDGYFAKGPKPYPELEVVVAAHDASLAAFLGADHAEKKRVRRSLGIVLSEGLANHALVYEPVLRDLHTRLQAQDELHAAFYFRAPKLPESGELWRERPLAGALNLAEFIDTTTGKFLWEELKSALATALRLVVNWWEISNAGAPIVPQPWVGLTGWADALEKLELDYDDERALLLATRLSELLAAELREGARRLEGQKNLAPGTLGLSLRPTHSRFLAQVAGVRAGVLPENGFGRETALIAMQAAFRGGARGIFTLPRPERLEPECFTECLVNAARTGWAGVKFV